MTIKRKEVYINEKVVGKIEIQNNCALPFQFLNYSIEKDGIYLTQFLETNRKTLLKKIKKYYENK